MSYRRHGVLIASLAVASGVVGFISGRGAAAGAVDPLQLAKSIESGVGVFASPGETPEIMSHEADLRRYDTAHVYVDPGRYTITKEGANTPVQMAPHQLAPGSVVFHRKDSMVSEIHVNEDYRVALRRDEMSSDPGTC